MNASSLCNEACIVASNKDMIIPFVTESILTLGNSHIQSIWQILQLIHKKSVSFNDLTDYFFFQSKSPKQTF
jgi:hypothetical protein